jgi:hypothetical protein
MIHFLSIVFLPFFYFSKLLSDTWDHVCVSFVYMCYQNAFIEWVQWKVQIYIALASLACIEIFSPITRVEKNENGMGCT